MSAIRDLVRAAAQQYGIQPALVLALVRVESSENPWASRPEAKYRYLWDVAKHAPFRTVTEAELASRVAPKDFPKLAGTSDQEWLGQAQSWGLMQIMGALARELGFRGLYLNELCDPAVNLAIGCAHLSGLLKWSRTNGRDEMSALAAWNGGKSGNAAPPYRNVDYARKVLLARDGITDF